MEESWTLKFSTYIGKFTNKNFHVIGHFATNVNIRHLCSKPTISVEEAACICCAILRGYCNMVLFKYSLRHQNCLPTARCSAQSIGAQHLCRAWQVTRPGRPGRCDQQAAAGWWATVTRFRHELNKAVFPLLRHRINKAMIRLFRACSCINYNLETANIQICIHVVPTN